MQSKIGINSLFLLAILVFNFLFWKEQMGLNTLLFALLMVPLLLFINLESRKNKAAVLLALGTLLTAIFVLIHNSVISKFLHLASFVTLVGLVQQRELRFLWYGFLLGCWSFLETPRKLIRHFVQGFPSLTYLPRGFYYLRIALVPIMILPLFYILYYLANPRFAEFSDIFWRQFEWLLNWNIPLPRLFFFLVSMLVCGGILLPVSTTFFQQKQMAQQDDLIRQRLPKMSYGMSSNPMALRNEYHSGLMLIIALNVLLLLVNLTDIRYVWLGFDPDTPQNLKTFVHEGTYLLIAAILLAMAVLLFLFRRNLNFFPNKQMLLRGAYLWIAQNALLALSVGIRNYHYIDFHGMAYKRIGVILFLLLVFYGLWSMYVKISRRKSFYFLLSRNAWALYGILLLCSSINWDVWITRYNLTVGGRSSIDVEYMLREVSDKNLFLLQAHFDRLATLDSYPVINSDQIESLYQRKEKRFWSRQNQIHWPSWNYSDYRNRQYLQK